MVPSRWRGSVGKLAKISKFLGDSAFEVDGGIGGCGRGGCGSDTVLKTPTREERQLGGSGSGGGSGGGA
jgi:hypothetical protein